MKLRSARALDGLLWLRAGVRQVVHNPLRHLAMVSVMMMMMGVLMSLPVVGVALGFAILPSFTAGWVFSTHAAGLGLPPGPGRLFVVLTSPRRSVFVWLGLLYAAAALVVLALADLLDPGLADQWQLLFGGQASAEAAGTALEAVQSGVMLRGAMLLPVMLFFWHAPVILMRTSDSLPKALFASALGSLRNLGAFAVYGLAWVMADVISSSVLGVVLTALAVEPQFAILLALPMALLLTAAFYASLHASVEGCLVIEGGPPA
jgi:hypothetical protein